MARGSAGKWVARAGATGHSRTYRGQAPVNWYAGLVVIVVLGIVSVLWAGYEYRHPGTGTTTTQPTTKTTWYAGIAFDVCGTTQSALASNTTTGSKSGRGIFTSGGGVITVSPKTGNEAGKNAVLGKFVSGYKGLTLTSTHLVVPVGKKPLDFKNGDTCPKGSPDAGKKGAVHVVYWPSAFTHTAKPKEVVGDPATLRFSDNQLITVGFVPSNAKLGKNVSVVENLLRATGAASTSSTSTTAPTSSSTTPTSAATSSSTTTAPATPTTTTAPPTTTTGSPAKK